MTEEKLSWHDFKNLVLQECSDSESVYRGQANSDWLLEPTLYRFLGKKIDKIRARTYYNHLCSVISHPKIKKNRDFSDIWLTDNSPFLVSLLAGDEEHNNKLKKTFQLMIKLRHLGYPTLILDWTKDPFIASFFAFSESKGAGEISIYRMKKKNSNQIFGTNIHLSEFEFSDKTHYRHKNQESMYSLITQHDHIDTVLAKEKRRGPDFYIGNYESLKESNYIITKYIITDSPYCGIKYLKELYDNGYSFESVFGTTHVLENTLIRDLAIQEIILSDHFQQTTPDILAFC